MPNLRKLKKIAMSSAMAAPAALGLSMTAHAASTGAPPLQPFAVSLGGSFLTDNNSRNATTDTGFHVGLDYALNSGKNTGSSTPSIDLDYDDNTGHGNYLRTYGAFLTDRITLSKNKTSSVQPYVGAGIGLAYIQGRSHYKFTTGAGSTLTTHTGTHSQTATNFAGKLLAGVTFGQAFVEVSYAINGSVHGGNDDILDVSIGTHF